MKLWIALFVLVVIGLGFFYLKSQKTSSPVFPNLVTNSPVPKQFTIVAAGDIACDDLPVTSTQCQQDATAKLIEQINPELVLTLGDEQYGGDSLDNYLKFYDKSWGKFKDKTRPSIGNHEYEQDEVDQGDAKGAGGYFDYFNGIGQLKGPAGDRPKGYYSYQKNGWSFYVLNTNCGEIGGCGENSPEGEWLDEELAVDNSKCQLIYFHQPLFSSGLHGPNKVVQAFWNIMYRHEVDLIVNGHDHLYERFAPQNPDGKVDQTNGIREFVVGTGGRNLYQVTKIMPNSEVRIPNIFGVLQLDLNDNNYSWKFIAIDNQVKDLGVGSCF